MAIGEGAVADSGIRGLVGLRIYRIGHVPQRTSLPYLIYQRVADPPRRYQGGHRLREAQYRFFCVGETVGDSLTLSDALLDWLDNYRGTLGLPTEPVTVRWAGLTARSHLPERPSNATERGPHIIEQDYTIFYVS